MGIARAVFVDLGDTHGPLGQDENGAATTGDWLTDDLGRKYMVEGNPQGLLYHYATLAAAIADTVNLRNGQYVMIAGGDQGASGIPDADRGVWQVTASQGAAFANYTKVLDGYNTAAEIGVVDTAGFFAATNVESALAEIATKQVFFKLAHASLYNKTVNGATSTAFDAAIKAMVIDNGTGTDAAGVGTSTVSGIIQSSAWAYQIPIRDASTRDIIDDGSNNEVYARLTFAGGSYVVSFYSYKAGVETAYTFASAKAIDLGYVLVSQDLMRLPAHAGIVEGEFFGDQSGATGTLTDNMIVTNAPAFTGLLLGQATQEACNLKIDELGLTGLGQGASLIAIHDAAGLLAATNVEAALAELATLTSNRVKSYANVSDAIAAAPHTLGTYIIIAGVTDPAERGIYQIASGTGTMAGDYNKVLDVTHNAAEVILDNGTGWFSVSDVQAAIEALTQAVGGGANAFSRDYSSNSYVTDGDDVITAIGKLDAAIGALLTDRVASKAFTANEAINAATNGPRLVSADGAAWKVNLAVAGSVGPKVKVLGFATGADYALNGAINQGDGLVMSGICTGFTGLTPGARYYADPATPGNITATPPNVVGQWFIPVGVAVSPTALVVQLGEPTEIVPAQNALQRAIHWKSTAGAAGGLGESGYPVAVGDIWINDDTTVQNPDKSGLGRYTQYICKVAWTGAGAALTRAQVLANFVAVGKQG